MLDKDKLFIVVYVGVHGFGDQTVSEILANVANHMQYDDSVNTLIIPTRDSETRAECINPVLLSEEQYEETRKRVESLTEKVEEAIKMLKENKG
jgi:hypothetical protein